MLSNTNNEPLDFAAIGHQDSWKNIKLFVNGIRGMDYEELPVSKIKDIFGYIPPRSVFKMKVRSKNGTEINGVYIETFIDPDKLDPRYVRKNINKLGEAIEVAQKLNTRIIALGGFTSIILEGNMNAYTKGTINLTTGNTLTSAYILKGIEKAANKLNLNIKDSNLLVLGATGDIGMACTNYLKDKVKRLLLCARNEKRLKNLSVKLTNQNFNVIYNTSVNVLAPEADIVISVASSSNIEIKKCKKNVLICDAGYPKNIDQKIEESNHVFLFHGGMGQIQKGFDFQPDYSSHFYNYPAPNIGHGCILEAIVLAFEKRYENFSVGKGNIKKDKIDEIYMLALKHGLELAPFYNRQGLW